MPVEAYHRPDSLEEALDLSAEHESDLEVISGGTVSMPAMNDGYKFPEKVMDLRSVGLDYVESENGEITLGATLTLTQTIEELDDPFLQDAARHTASWAVRNMATVGGNLFTPPPLGDFAVALLARDAEIKIQSQDDDRWISLSSFYTGPGQNVLEPEELITEIRFPEEHGETVYLKQTQQQEPAPPVVTVAANLERENGTVETARIAMNGAGPHPMRMEDAEAALEGAELDEETIEAAAEAAAEAANPPEDAVASEWYRQKMVRQQLVNALSQIASEEDTQ
ncbi:FAD binding domain-containing protein (plasmid) [Natrialbaceae archaeon A-arb3/5]